MSQHLLKGNNLQNAKYQSIREERDLFKTPNKVAFEVKMISMQMIGFDQENNT